MLNFHKNELINATLVEFYKTFEHTLDTVDYVPEKYNAKICAYIFKNMKKAFRKIDRVDLVDHRIIRKQKSGGEECRT